MKEKITFAFVMLLTGGIIYFYFEIFTRGYSHISMFLLGGVCFALVGYIGNRMLGKKIHFAVKLLIIMLSSSVIITSLELLTGIYVNLYLELNVWDYSHMKINLIGQICLLYSMIWGLMGLPCVYIYGIIENNILRSGHV